jgi:hypothetical protein
MKEISIIFFLIDRIDWESESERAAFVLAGMKNDFAVLLFYNFLGQV